MPSHPCSIARTLRYVGGIKINPVFDGRRDADHTIPIDSLGVPFSVRLIDASWMRGRFHEVAGRNRTSEMRSFAERREFSRNEAKPSFAAGLEPWRLPTQTQSFSSINGNVCFRRKPPPGGSCDRDPNPLMTAIGW